MSKTGAGLAKWAEDIYQGKRHVYWWGTYCNPCTADRLAGKTIQYPTHYGANRQATYKKHIEQGKICTDCAGLIKGYYWELDGVIKYGRNSLPDKGANGLYQAAKIKGKINTLPDIPGVLLWTQEKGHVAVYVGNGYEVEARSFAKGIQRNRVANRNFAFWGLCPYVEYTAEEVAKATAAMGGKVTGTSKPQSTKTEPQGGASTLPTIRKGAQGVPVRVLQRMLLAAGCKLSRYGVDGDYGAETEAAVRAFQATHNLTIDGVCGPLTWAALAG